MSLSLQQLQLQLPFALPSSDVLQLGLGHFATLAFGVWAALKHRYIYAFFRTLPRDVTALVRVIKVFRDLYYVQRRNITVGQIFDENATNDPSKVILYFEDEKWTNEQVQKWTNKIANYFQEQGLKKGDSVAIFMENRPEYLCIWLGLSKTGVVAALTNYNLRLQSLQHCFEAVNCKAVIYNEELSPALEELVQAGQLSQLAFYSLCGMEGKPAISRAINLEKSLESISHSHPVVPEKIEFQDKLFYIYTSGTTGLPKAAIIKHSRYMMAAVGNFYMHGCRRDDILYTALPLYHASGNMLGGGIALCFGVPMVIRKKFSASNFWKDCIKYNVTAAQYIGEICRYLIAQPPSPYDSAHRVRLMFGNGLRREIWPDFVKRFNIPQINELYGATEGNCNMVNIDNKVGAVGFLPWHLSWLIPYHLIKVDAEGEPLRDKNGWVIPCEPGEAGELIGKIQKNHPIRDYLGYADKSSSKGKILENAFKKGDAYFRSGDILTRDIYGYFYFKDRKGDTFRWKGENCSTAEVESVISSVIGGLKDVVVYGVQIPGTEGRAGMAAIADPDETLDLDSLIRGISKVLPSYARPLFIRTLQDIEKTGTFKLQKLRYQREGFDVTKIEDKVFVLLGSKYVPLTSTIYEEIMQGKIRF